MEKLEYKLTDPRGIHARPAGQLVKLLSEFKCSAKLTFNDQSIDAKKLLAVMKLAMQQGDVFSIEFSGEDESLAKSQVLEFLTKNL